MRTRIVSSIGVVIAGLVPIALGGPVFVLLMMVLGLVGYREYVNLMGRVEGKSIPGSVIGAGATALLAFVAIAFLGLGQSALVVVVFAALALPLLLAMREHGSQLTLSTSGLVTSGALYLGIPIFSAVVLRADRAPVSALWLNDFAGRLAVWWAPAPRGLAWTLVVVLATWVGDSTALLAGRRVGRRKLAPTLSPNKTLEGALGGLVGSAVAGSLTFAACGLGALWLGFLVGIAIGAAGQVGDLTESFLKRQAGVKDSGSVIPGHGGVLDRIDALLFALPLGLMLATIAAQSKP